MILKEITLSRRGIYAGYKYFGVDSSNIDAIREHCHEDFINKVLISAINKMCYNELMENGSDEYTKYKDAIEKHILEEIALSNKQIEKRKALYYKQRYALRNQAKN
jgi:hypothetical protein